MKFLNMRRPSDQNSSPPLLPSHPPHGVSMPTSPVVVLNALGYIGFKVVSTCGNCKVSKFSLEGYCNHWSEGLVCAVTELSVHY